MLLLVSKGKVSASVQLAQAGGEAPHNQRARGQRASLANEARFAERFSEQANRASDPPPLHTLSRSFGAAGSASATRAIAQLRRSRLRLR